MINRDYILMLIEQFGFFLRKIFFHVENEEFDDALKEVGKTYNELLGMDGELVRNMSSSQITGFLKVAGSTHFEKSLIIASLFKVEGDIEKRQNGFTRFAFDKYMTAFNLFLDAFQNKEELRIERFLKESDQIASDLWIYDNSEEFGLDLLKYYELRGCFDKAENVLFDLAENGNVQIIQKGISFYNSLLKKSDEELDNGKLPRTEILDSMKVLQEKIQA
ncbi:MAG: DUF6483 family protein [Syntrophothermus sp.]